MHRSSEQEQSYTNETHQLPFLTAHKKQDPDVPVDSIPKVSPQLSKITQSTIGNFWESLEAYDAGPTYSKELKSLSWYTQTMQTYNTTENHKKSDHA
jgi:hypothetical protein